MKRILKWLLYLLLVTIFDNSKAQTICANIKAESLYPDTIDLCHNDNEVTLDGNPFYCISGIAYPSGAILSHQWSGNGISYLSSTNTKVTTFYPTTIGLFKLIYTVTDTSFNVAKDSVIIRVTPMPNPYWIYPPDSIEKCKGDTVNIIMGGAYTATWRLGFQSNLPPLQEGVPYVVVLNSSTTITLTSGQTVYGCMQLTNKRRRIYVFQPPELVVTPNRSFCGPPGNQTITANYEIGSDPPGYTSLLWSTGETTSSIIVNPTSTTTYSVTASNDCFSETKTHTITIYNIPTITTTPSNPAMCQNSFVTITAQGASNYVWNDPLGCLNQTTGATVNASPNYTTTVTVTGTTVEGCSNSTVVTITVNSLPDVTVTPPYPIVCKKDTVRLTASGASSYTWSPSTFLSATTGQTVTCIPTVTQSYTVTGTDANNCKNTTEVTVSVFPDPNIQVTAIPTNYMCRGQCVTLSASGGVLYQWAPATGLSGTIGSSVTACPSVTTTYTVTGTDNNGCKNTATITLTVHPLPNVNIFADDVSLCYGSWANLTATGAQTYVWGPASVLSSTTGSNVQAFPNSNVTVTVTGTDANGCQDTAQIYLHVIPITPIVVVPPSVSICERDSTTITASGATSYVWAPASIVNPSVGATVSVKPSSTVIVSVTGTDDNGCSATNQVNVIVNPLPTITATTSNNTICMGNSTNLSASGGVLYYWAPVSSISPSSGANVTATPTSTTTYTVTGIDANNCRNTATVTITVNPLPTVTATANPSTICSGNNTILQASGATNYIWAPGPYFGSLLSISPMTTTTYTVTGTSLPSGCSNTATVTVTVRPSPTVVINPNPAAVCEGTPAMLTASGAVSYQWSNGASTSSITISPSSTTIISVTGTAANGCIGTAQATVNVSNKPLVQISPNNITICQGSSTTLTATGANSYTWGPSSILSSTNTSSVTATPTANVTVTVTGTNAAGCTNTAIATINVDPAPTLTVNISSNPICEGNTTTITANGAVSYLWSNGETTQSIIVSPTITQTYTVTGSGVVGCSSTTTATVNVNPKPNITISASQNPICQGQSVTLTASGGNTYTWSGGGTGATKIVTPSTTTTYTVTGTNLGGCSNTNQITITVNPLPTLSLSASNTSVCRGQTVTISASGGNSYQWAPVPPLSSSTGQTVTLTPTSTVTVTCTASNNYSCTKTETITINVYPDNNITFNPPNPVICGGNSVTITASGGATYHWSPETTPPTGPVVVASPTTTTTYTVTGTEPVYGCNYTETITVTVAPAAVADAGPTKYINCGGPAVTIGTPALSGYSYSWSPINGIIGDPNIAQPMAKPTITTSFTVTATSNYGCSATDTVFVVITDTPIADAGQDKFLNCGDTTTIGSSSQPGLFYSWSPSTNLSDPLVAQPKAYPQTTTTYTLTVSNILCAATDDVTVSVMNAPQANAGPDRIIDCYSTDSVQLGVSAIPGYTYSWSPITGLSNPNIANPKAKPTITTTYTLTVSSGYCYDIDVVTVTVNNVPFADAGVNKTINCSGSVQIGTPAITGHTYSWAPAIGLNDPNIAQPIASPSGTTTYTLTVSNGVCQNVDSVVVFVNNAPVANAGPNKSIQCGGDSVTIGTPAISGNVYSWTPTTGLSNPNIAQPKAKPTTTTTYTLTVDNGFCTSTSSVTVFVTDIPPVNAGPDKTINCNGDSVTIGAQNLPGLTYTWSPSSGLADPNTGITKARPTMSTVYTLTVSNGVCINTDEVIITVLNVPNVELGPNKSIICGGGPVTIGITAESGVSYNWAPTIGLSNPTSSITTAQPLSTTTYTLTADNGQCQATDNITVFVTNAPIANPGSNKTIDCNGDSVLLGTPAQPNTTYSWAPIIGLSNPLIAQPKAKPNTTTTYTLTADNGDCQSTATVTVTVLNIPSIDVGPNKTIDCYDTDSVQIGNQEIAGYIYSWSPNQYISNPNKGITKVKPPTTTTYTLTVDNGACIATQSVTITVNNIPYANAGPNKSIECGQTTPVQIGTPAQPGNTYTWAPINGLDNPNIAQPNALPSSTQTYTLTVSNGVCFNTSSVTIFVNNAPTYDAGQDKTINCGSRDSVLIGNPGNPSYVYSWAPSSSLSNPNASQTKALPSMTTVYTVTVSNNNCHLIDSVRVIVLNTPLAIAGPDKTIPCGSNDSVLIGSYTIPQPGVTYSWSPSLYLSNPTASQTYAKPPTTTTYILTVDNGQCQATDNVIITVNNLPNVYTGPNQTIPCGSTTPVTIGGPPQTGYTYSWSPPNGLQNPNSSQTTALPNITTTYTLVVDNGNCLNSSTVTIFVQNSPFADAGNDVSISCGGSTTIGTSDIPGYSYSWQPTNNVNTPTSPQPIVSPQMTTVYTLTVYNGQCYASDTVKVTVLNAPIADAGPDRLIGCGALNGVTIGSPAQTGLIYNWSSSPPDNNFNPTLSQPTVRPLTTTTYYLTVSDGSCSSTDEVTVYVFNTPVLIPAPDKSINCGDSVEIGNMIQQPGYYYNWSPTIGLSNPNIPKPKASPRTTTTYTLTVIDATSGCYVTDEVTVTVLDIPYANAGIDVTVGCGTSNGVQIGTPGQSNWVYNWAPTNSLSSPTIPQPIAYPDIQTTYTVSVYNQSGCYATDDVTVYVYPNEQANAGPDVSINCGDNNGVMIGTTSIPGCFYEWAPHDGLNNPYSATPIAKPQTTTTYTLTLVNITGCSSTDVVTVYVNNAPIANAGPNVSINCGSSSGVIIGTPPQIPGLTYLWTPNLYLSPNNTIPQPTANPPTTTDYILQVTDPLTGCYDLDTVTVFVVNSPIADAGPDKSIGCVGPNYVVIGNNTGPYSYIWSPGSTLNDSTLATPLASPTTNTTYTLTVSNGLCYSTDNVSVFVIGRPIVTLGNDIYVCKNETVHLMAYGQNFQNPSYQWSTGNNDTLINVTIIPTTTVTITLTVTNLNGCQATDDIVVNVMPSIEVDLGNTIYVGQGMHVSITPSISNGTPPYSYSWNITNQNLSSVTFFPNTDTTLVIVTVSSPTECSGIDSVLVIQVPLPVANAGNDTSLCVTSSYQLIGSATSGKPPYYYTWNINDGLPPDSILTLSNLQVGTYTFILTVTDSYGLSDIDSVNVEIIEQINVNLGPDREVCFQQPVTLTSTPGDFYQWNTGETTQSITVLPNVTTTYYVTVTKGNCYGTDDVIISLYPYIKPYITANKSVFCDNAPVQTWLYVNPPNTFNSIRWNTSEVTDSIFTTTPGNYFVTIIDNYGCIIKSDTFKIVQLPPLKPLIVSSTGSFEFCENDYIYLSTDTSYYVYIWSTGSVTPNIKVFESGNIFVDVIDFYGCKGRSDTVQIIQYPQPFAYASYQQTGVYEATFYNYSYHGTSWYWNFGDNQTYNGFNPGTHTYPQTNTFYTVTLTVVNACGSDTYTFTVWLDNNFIGLSEKDSIINKISIYPNPADDFVIIDLNSKISTDLNISIENITGQSILNKKYSISDGKNILYVEISQIPAGIYTLKLNTNRHILITKIIIY